MKFKHTENCIICLKKAFVWTGHVIRQKECVLAGFCYKHINEMNKDKIKLLNLINKQGCFGAYHPKYGIKREK